MYIQYIVIYIQIILYLVMYVQNLVMYVQNVMILWCIFDNLVKYVQNRAYLYITRYFEHTSQEYRGKKNNTRYWTHITRFETFITGYWNKIFKYNNVCTPYLFAVFKHFNIIHNLLPVYTMYVPWQLSIKRLWNVNYPHRHTLKYVYIYANHNLCIHEMK
jgi:hypothetical protein